MSTVTTLPQPRLASPRHRALRWALGIASGLLLLLAAAFGLMLYRMNYVPDDLDLATTRLSNVGEYRASYEPRRGSIVINQIHAWTLHVTTPDADALMSELNRIPVAEVRARRRDGHRPYVGWLEGAPVTYGWVATREAAIGELHVTLRLTPRGRYLWDFATLPAWQGRGLYPHLLQAILRQEAPEAERFWIIYAPENLPSGAGMRKAGFAPTAELSYDKGGSVRLAPLGERERARTAAALLGVPLGDDALAPCWCCNTDKDVQADDDACWPPKPETRACTCAIELRPAARTTPALAPA